VAGRLVGRSQGWLRAGVAAAIASLVVAVSVALLPHPATSALPALLGSSTAATIEIVPGLALVGAGIIVWLWSPATIVAGLSLSAGVLWFGPSWLAWTAGPALVPTVGLVATPLLVATVVALVGAAWAGSPSRLYASTLAAIVVCSAIVAIGRGMVYDPFDDAACITACGHANLFLVMSLPSVDRTLRSLAAIVQVGAGLTLLVMSAPRFASRSAWTGSYGRVIGLGAGSTLGLGWAAGGLFALLATLSGSLSNLDASTTTVAAASLIAIALGLALGVAERLRAIDLVRGLAVQLGTLTSSGSLQMRLATALTDDTVEVAFPLPNDGGYVDTRGRPVPEPTSATIQSGAKPISSRSRCRTPTG